MRSLKRGKILLFSATMNEMFKIRKKSLRTYQPKTHDKNNNNKMN